ncbi:MAG: hypothetical protein ACP5HZ_03330 [Ferrimicrobium sp.]
MSEVLARPRASVIMGNRWSMRNPVIQPLTQRTPVLIEDEAHERGDSVVQRSAQERCDPYPVKNQNLIPYAQRAPVTSP